MPFFVLFVHDEPEPSEDEPPQLHRTVCLGGGPYASKDEAETSLDFVTSWRQRELLARAGVRGDAIPTEECRVAEASDGQQAMWQATGNVRFKTLEHYPMPSERLRPTNHAAPTLPELVATEQAVRTARAELWTLRQSGIVPPQAAFERLERAWQSYGVARSKQGRRNQRVRRSGSDPSLDPVS
jgi:hypothetical protein